MIRSAATSIADDRTAMASEPTRMAQAGRLSSWSLLAYGGFAMPLILSEIPILLYLPAFYAQEVGLTASLVGLVFLSARVWDGMADVAVGWMSDQTKWRMGRRKPWVTLGAPFLMFATWFLCNPPEGAGLLYLAIWAALFYTADAIAKVSYLSWGTELTTDYGERSRVTAFRGTFSMLGTLLFVSAPILFLPSGAPLSDTLLLISIAVIVIVPLTIVPLAVFVPDPLPAVSTHVGILKGLAALAKDRIFVMFGIAILFYSIANGVINSLAVFSFSVGLELPTKLAWAIFILYIATLCSVPLMMRLATHIEKHRVLCFALAMLAIAYAGHLLVPAGNFVLVGALWVAAGIGNSAALVLPTSMLADIIDRGEVAASERNSGSYMAIYNLTMKIGLALGVGLSFGLLDLVGYDPAATQHSAADAFNVRLLGFGLPALMLLPAMVLIWRYPITRKVQQQLRDEIKARSSSASFARPRPAAE